MLTPTEFVNHGMNVMTTGQLNVSRFVASGPSANEVDIGTMLYYGHVAKGLPLRNGTDVSSAYQQPSMPDVIERDYTLTAPADIFIPGYQCVEVNTTNRFGDLNDDGSFELNLDVAPCPAALKDAPLNTTLMSTNLTIWTMPRKTRGPEGSAFLHLDYYQFPCPEFLGIGSSPQVLMGERTVRGSDPSIESTAFYVVSKLSLNSSDCRIKNYGIGDGMDCDITAKLSSVTTVACTANFAAKQIELSLRKAQRDSVRPFLLDTSHELSATDLSVQGFNNSLLQSVIPWLSEAAAGLSVIDYDMNSVDLYQPTYRVANNDTPIMLKRSGVEDGRDWHNLFEFFMNPIDAGGYASTINGTLLRHGVEETMNGILAQWGALELFSNNTATVVASASYSEDRLHIKPLSYWFMVACLLIMALLSIILTFNLPSPRLRSSPASMAGFTTLLAEDKHLQTTLNASIPQQKISVTADASKWYRPLSVQRPVIMLTLITPVMLVGVLGGLQHLSDSAHGIVQIDKSKPPLYLEGWTHYLPTVVMIGVAAAYDCLGFNVCLFSTFAKLKSGARSADTIDHDLSIQMKVRALVTSCSMYQNGAALSILAGLLGSTLTIVVSGLYSINTMPIELNMPYRFQSVINPMKSNGSGSVGREAATTLALIDQFNLSFPSWTNDQLVLPVMVAAPKLMTDEDRVMSLFMPNRDDPNITNSLLDIEIPAYRPYLDCTTLPVEHVAARLVTPLTSDGYAKVNITALPVLSEDCLRESNPLVDLGVARYTWEGARVHEIDNDGRLVAGYFSELSFSNGTMSEFWTPNYFACPSLAFMVASFDKFHALNASGSPSLDETLSRDTITVLQCTQKIEILLAEVQLRLPDFVIDKAKAPVLLDRALNNSFFHDNFISNFKGFGIHIRETFNTSYNLPTAPPSASKSFDSFMQGVLYGSEPHVVRDFIGSDPNTIDRFRNAVNRMYARYTAQFLNAYSREDYEIGSDRVSGKITSWNTYRLVQHRGPKTALQVLLSVMVFCAALAYRLVDMRRTLLREPCSIAGKASLIMGSRLLKQVKEDLDKEGEGVERCSPRRSLFEGYVLKLTWWEDREERDRIGQMIHGEDDGLDARWGIDVVQDF